MRITWHGNACLKIQSGENTLIFDPFFSRNPKLKPLVMEDIADADAILVSHGHFDHVADFPAITEQYPKPIYAPVEVSANLKNKLGIKAELLKDTSSGGPYKLGAFTFNNYEARHVKFDLPLLWELLAKLANPTSWGMFAHDIKDHLNMPMGSSHAWLIECEGKSILHFGSLGFAEDIEYPKGVDVLSLAFQGHSKIESLALAAVERLQPKALLLHHFDDAFPPISRYVDAKPMKKLMAERYPDVKLIVPAYRRAIEL